MKTVEYIDINQAADFFGVGRKLVEHWIRYRPDFPVHNAITKKFVFPNFPYPGQEIFYGTRKMKGQKFVFTKLELGEWDKIQRGEM
tara:strand:- start:146 stop:403 length:258 start_codon:yes stop_codon:yes gene_type:complete